MQYERDVACALTICPSVAERTGGRAVVDANGGELTYATVLTDANVNRATDILRMHGLVIVRGLLSPLQTVPWGDAALDDFNSAISRLKCHPTRPVDLMNPNNGNKRNGDDGTSDHNDDEDRAFEPLSYREMAMREDLRVDLRSGLMMDRLRRCQNDMAASVMGSNDGMRTADSTGKDDAEHYRPTIIRGDIIGTVACWRFHPSILAIIRATFNPRDDSLYRGNFGRWNFGGDGPNGSPQPLRLGQIGSVLSCPGSGDQAIHADTPHLFEHVNCLPCHYMNVFTPGYRVVDDASANNCFLNEFDDDGIFTGNTRMGGTAFVHGSHKLRVSTMLLFDDNDDRDDARNVMTSDAFAVARDDASARRDMLQLRTLRPALDAGDVIFFDCRTIHYGLANSSGVDETGRDVNAGRRPMLYVNVSQSWFHDPKNWDDRERIFA